MRATDYVLSDLMLPGGVSGLLRTAVLAEDARLPMSSHLHPEVSAHLLWTTPTAHWLEYVDWAETFNIPKLTIKNGNVCIPVTPRIGVE